MFDDYEKKAESVPVEDNSSADLKENSISTPQAESKDEIHTMPRKFQDHKEKKGGKNKFLIIGIVIIVVLVLAIGTAFLFKKIIKQTNENTNAVANENSINLNQNINNSNLNTNLNQNTNQNQNNNLNTNINTNSNTNQNLNSNLNTNTNLNTNLNLNVNGPVPSSKDSDRDSLTDKEEADLGTDPNRPDSDLDGYSDGVELANNFDPLGTGRLTASSAVKVYTNEDYNYTILYPHNWLAQATDQDNKEVLFTASTAEFVEVLVTENTTSSTIEEWYLTQFPDLTNANITNVTSWDDQQGILSLDGNTVYYASDKYIYIITYNVGTKKEANYRNTFVMMYQSFTPLPEETTNTNINHNTNQNTNSNTNTNTNSNRNSNLNSNENSNSNRNQNSNTNHNQNSNLND